MRTSTIISLLFFVFCRKTNRVKNYKCCFVKLGVLILRQGFVINSQMFTGQSIYLLLFKIYHFDILEFLPPFQPRATCQIQQRKNISLSFILEKKEKNFLERKTAWNRYFYLCILFFSSRFPHFLLFPASSCGLLRLPHRSLFHCSAEELFRRSANFGKALPPNNGNEIGEVNVGDRSQKLEKQKMRKS